MIRDYNTPLYHVRVSCINKKNIIEVLNCNKKNDIGK